MNPLSNYTTSKDNNFNLIRFVAASLVLVSHSFVLVNGRSGFEPLMSMVGLSLGRIAVDVFFIISGFLVTASLLLRNNLIAFAWNRVLRIYPALIIAVLFSALIIGGFFTTQSLPGFLTDPETYKFIIKNTTLVFGSHGTLNHVFEAAPYKNAVNISLWSLPWEVRMYGLLFILGIFYYFTSWLNKKKLTTIILSIGLISLIVHLANYHLQFLGNGRGLHIVRFLALFFTGASFYLLRDKIILSTHIASVMLVILFAGLFYRDAFFIFYYIFIAYIVLSMAYLPSGKIRKFNSVGDYSYGIYIYAFPVQQSLVAIYPSISIPIMIALSFVITFVLAFISWHVVEKNALKHKDKYVYIETIFKKYKFYNVNH